MLSTFCKACENSRWAHNCKKNHIGSSRAVEAVEMKRTFLRSEEDRGLRYVKYLGDGETKTFLELTKEKPYVKQSIKKLEYIGHVQKKNGYPPS